MLASLTLTLTLLGGATAAPAQDTVEAVSRLEATLGDHFWTYQGPAHRLSREEVGQLLGWVCDADQGGRCWLDPDFNFRCRIRGGCPGLDDPIYDYLLEVGEEHPDIGVVAGQSVYGLVKAGRHLDAMSVVENCAAEAWWCSALAVLLYQDVGQMEAAAGALDSMLAEADAGDLCEWLDASWLLGPFTQRTDISIEFPSYRRRWRDASCEARWQASDTVFWLADPLFVMDGNDRMTAYLANSIRWWAASWLMDAGRRASSAEFTAKVRARRVRRGPPDSWEHLQRSPRGPSLDAQWTSKKAARYHFVPDFEGEGFGKPSWRLMAEFEDEGYTPPYAPFYELPLQIARFRASADTMQRVATAGLVTGSEIESAAQSGYLIFTDAPESFPLQLEAPFREGRAVYLAEAETKPHAVSFEVLTSAGIGWHREWVEPLSTEGSGLSDVLLYRPTGMAEPDSLLAAAALMHGTTSLEPAELGLYWELYDVPAETPVEFALEARKADGGGLIDSLRRLLPGGGADEGSGQLAWTEPSTGPVHPRAIILDLRNLDDGEYDLVLRARWDGGEAETMRRVEVR